MIDYKAELNDEQLAVVYQGDGPCLVLAGAGSGKTRTIAYRTAYLLEQGIKPENILLVTFTNKAAHEMVARIQQLTQSKKSLPWAGTFHHIANKILRIYASAFGYRPKFAILDSEDSKSLIKLCVKSIGPEAATRSSAKFPSAAVLLGIFSYARNAESEIKSVLEMKYPSWMAWSDDIKKIYNEYQKKKMEANAMDFDDLLVNFLLLLQRPEILEKYAEQFHYIFVDEYQDTNRIQASIVKKLASRHRNILAVGDDAQSIYSFRAADIKNILSFKRDYPEAKVFKLETNYRSSDEILSLANAVIANNVKQYKKRLRTIFSSGAKPEFRPHANQQEEAAFVARKIAELLEEGVLAKDIAVLFRAAHHSQNLEMQLVKAGIDYDYRGGLRFFERAHIKDILAYLRILNNPADTAAWLRVLLREEGIGPVGAERVIDYIKKTKDVEEIKTAGEAVLSDRALAGWYNFFKIWNGLVESGGDNPTKLIETVMKHGYADYLEAEYIDSRERGEDIKQLIIFAKKHDDLTQFLAETSLAEEQSGRLRAMKRNKADKIVLSTVHQAKGLEWAAVFVINLIEGAFPHERAIRESGGLEEERRLFYVAITRAKKYLYLNYPMENFGRHSFSSGGPSLFLEEIDRQLLDDRSLLSAKISLDDDEEGVRYVSEDNPISLKSGCLLRDIDDL